MTNLTNDIIMACVYIGGIIAHEGGLFKKILPFLRGAEKIFEEVQGNKEAQKAIEDIKQALTSETAAERDALIKSAIYCAVTALGVEITKLDPIQVAGIAGFVTDSLPDKFKADVTPDKVTEIIKLIQAEIAAANNHNGLQAIVTAVNWLQGANQPQDQSQKTA